MSPQKQQTNQNANNLFAFPSWTSLSHSGNNEVRTIISRHKEGDMYKLFATVFNTRRYSQKTQALGEFKTWKAAHDMMMEMVYELCSTERTSPYKWIKEAGGDGYEYLVLGKHTMLEFRVEGEKMTEESIRAMQESIISGLQEWWENQP